MTAQFDYWLECIQNAAEDCGATLTDEQARAIAEAVQGGHECYGQAFYSPPSSERRDDINREWKEKLERAERESEAYREAAENNMRRALRLHRDTPISFALTEGQRGFYEDHQIHKRTMRR